MRDYNTTSDLLSGLFYESIDRVAKGYEIATDVVRHNDGSLWSESVHQEVDAWYDSERRRVIAEAGYTEEEWKRLEDEETEAWYAQIEKNWDEYQESINDLVSIIDGELYNLNKDYGIDPSEEGYSAPENWSEETWT